MPIINFLQISMRGILTFFLFFTLINIAFSATESLKIMGSYFGKNLIVINPMKGESFVVKSVMVNSKVTDDEIQSSVFEIDLSKLGLELGEKITISIEYDAGAEKPVIYNPDVIRLENNFAFATSQIDKKSNKITWTITGSPGEESFEIEQFRWDKWVRVGMVKPGDSIASNTYNCDFSPHFGKNLYRIKLVNANGTTVYSQQIKYQSKCPEVFIQSSKTENAIAFSAETMYQVYNEKGIMVLNGTGNQIDISTLEHGKYYINYDNKTEQYSRK